MSATAAPSAVAAIAGAHVSPREQSRERVASWVGHCWPGGPRPRGGEGLSLVYIFAFVLPFTYFLFFTVLII